MRILQKQFAEKRWKSCILVSAGDLAGSAEWGDRLPFGGAAGTFRSVDDSCRRWWRIHGGLTGNCREVVFEFMTHLYVPGVSKEHVGITLYFSEES